MRRRRFPGTFRADGFLCGAITNAREGAADLAARVVRQTAEEAVAMITARAKENETKERDRELRRREEELRRREMEIELHEQKMALENERAVRALEIKELERYKKDLDLERQRYRSEVEARREQEERWHSAWEQRIKDAAESIVRRKSAAAVKEASTQMSRENLSSKMVQSTEVDEGHFGHV